MAGTNSQSNFEFIRDDVLRENLDRAFEHIIELVSLAGSPKYNPVLKSSFRKTIIIYTASIIEALLLYVLKKHKTEEECSLERPHFKILKEIYRIDTSRRIVLGEDRVERQKLRFDKVNLDQVNKLCKDQGLIDSELHVKINRVREMRNRQHLGGLSEIDRDYNKKDLEFVFSVASEVKEFARNS